MKIFQLALLAALCSGASAFTVNSPSASLTTTTPTRGVATAPQIVRFASEGDESESSSAQDEEPSDVNSEMVEEEEDSTEKESSNKPTASEPESSDSKAETLQKLLALSARTGRGEFASVEDREAAMELVQALEGSTTSLQGVAWQEKMYGRWELVYSSTELFRSSPFFMAGRAVCTTDQQAQQYNWFCEMHRKALAISTIGAVRQIVSPSRLISEFEVKAGAVPFLRKFSPFSYSGGLPVAIEGAIVSSADIDTVDEGDAWEISMDTVEIKGSNLPGLRQLLDTGLKLESRQLGSFLENNLPNYSNPKPILETTYLDDRIRISRDQDNNVFVYSKVSSVMDPTDYSSVMPDLGVTRLLEGFNDSVTKIYL